jgi:hypothetical protein
MIFATRRNPAVVPAGVTFVFTNENLALRAALEQTAWDHEMALLKTGRAAVAVFGFPCSTNTSGCLWRSIPRKLVGGVHFAPLSIQLSGLVCSN